jgi:hypothetical protein
MKPYNSRQALIVLSAVLCFFTIAGIPNAAGDTIQCFNLDTNPGWTTEGQWAFGVPAGLGSYCHDPTSGYTGTNVYGYNLNGDYPNNMPEYRLISTAIDCRNYLAVTLSFWRWLGIESVTWDHAKVEVSNNGSTWTVVWNHNGSSFCDGAWLLSTYNISAVADNQPTVYIRWTMGPTDSSVTYPGWNIDDICLTGTRIDGLSVTPEDGLVSSGYQGGPFTPSSKDYTITNTNDGNSGGLPFDWAAAPDVSWLDIQPDAGTLQPGENVVVTVSINDDADALDVGIYSANVTFVNLTSGFNLLRPVELDVNEIPPPPPPPVNPNPADGAMLVHVNTLLQWNQGGGGDGGSSELQNGGFETGDFTGWTIVTGPGGELTPWAVGTNGSGYFQNGSPLEGAYFAQNGFDGDAGLFYDIFQEIAIPNWAVSATLQWSERLQWNIAEGAIARPYEVTLQPAGGGTPLATLFSTTLTPGISGDTGYVPHSVDLLTAAPGIVGQTVRINFHESIPETYTGPAQFDLDGASLTLSNGTIVKKVNLTPFSYNNKSVKAGNNASALKDLSAYMKMKEKALASKQLDNLYGSQMLSQPATTDPAFAAALSAGNLTHSVATVNNEIIIDASDRGWYRNDGYHNAANKNTLTGRSSTGYEYHSFFVFDLTSVPGSFLRGAKLRLEVEKYLSPDSSEALTICDVTTPIEILTSSGTNLAVYDDLGSGNGYATFTVVPANVGNVLEIILGEQALADIVAASGGLFAIGLKVNDIGSPSGSEGVRFSAVAEPRVHQLVLTADIPATYNVYFDTVNPPGNLIHTGLLEPYCAPLPHPLDYATTYYWQVLAVNRGGQTPGPVWSFTTMGPPGEIEVTDSIDPANDLNMPFGEVIVDANRIEEITITNVHPDNALVIRGVSLASSPLTLGAFDLSINLPAVDGRSESPGDSYLPLGWISPQRDESQLIVKKGFLSLNGTLDILLVASGPDPVTLRTGLAAFPDVNSVVYFNAIAGVPTLAQLNAYDVVVVMSATTFSNAVLTGDVLADYVDGGGKVIEAVACFATQGPWELQGRFVSGDYEPFIHSPGEFIAHSLGAFDNTHPIMAGITVLTDSVPVGVALKPQAALVASWNNNTPLVATRDDDVVGINIYAFDFGNWTGDVILLFHNAAVWLAGQVPPQAGGFRLENVPQLPVEVPPLGSISFNVICEPPGLWQYNDSVTITSDDADQQQVSVALSGVGIPDYIDISPQDASTFSGHPGGPFMPSKIRYTLLNNNSAQSMVWSATKTADWISVSPAGGTIAPGGAALVTVKPTSAARMLPQGDYNDVLVFTNLTTTVQHTRDVLLHIFTAPKMWLDPPEGGFNVVVRRSETLPQTLTIGNSGDGVLSFGLSSQELPAPLAGKSSVAELAAGTDEMVFEYSFERPATERAADYDLLKMKGLEPYEQTGAPIVPVRPVKILVPCGKQVVDCRVTAEQIHTLPDSFVLPPAQKPYPLSYKGPINPTPKDPQIYNSVSLWPGRYFESVSTQSKRGYQVLVLNLFPLQYEPLTGSVSYASKLVLTITLADAVQSPKVMPSNDVKTKLASSLDNPEALESYPADNGLKDAPVPLTLPPGGPYQYVVITNQALQNAPGPSNFQTLCAVKTADGIPATIVTTEWIYANYDGTKPSGGSDNQTRIRNFLIDAYQNWGTQYVLLGGTNAIVPARLFYVNSLAGAIDYMPVDMYYGCVEPTACTFDNDADNLYGEPTDGPGGSDVDLFAEIYVGRAPVENAAELANFISKTLTYNTTQDEYLPRIAMVGEYLGFGGVAEYATDSMEQIRTGGTFDGYFTRGFENHNQPSFIDFNTIGNIPGDPTCAWPLYDASGFSWPKTRLTCLMNGGVHIFNHLGHANETNCMKLTTSDLPLLTNNDYFFAYSQGCYPGAFDTSNCFAEVMTTTAHAAFAVVMNARYGWGMGNSTDGPSQRYDRQFWDAVLGEGMYEIGRANQDSKEDNVSSINGECMRWIYYELNLFGDPAQKFRFSQGCEWMTLDPVAGVVQPASSQDVGVVFSAGQLPLGDYYAEIAVASNDPYNPYVIVPVIMHVVPGDFVVSPEDNFVTTGVMGGPFEPLSKTYTLNNNGSSPLDWQVRTDALWLNVEPNSGTLAPGGSCTVSVSLNDNALVLEPNSYAALVTFTDLMTGFEYTRAVDFHVTVPDFFTELFDAQDNDLDNLTLTLFPDASGHFYTPCLEAASAFPTDPAGGVVLPLNDDDYAEIVVADGKSIPFYRQYFDTFYVGSNGYITFDTGDVNPVETLEDHFLLYRISALFDDLNPAAGGTVSYKQLADKVAVTYQNVPEYSLYTTNSFQIELFFDGTIRLTWLNIAAQDGLAGLSPGNGLADYFIESDISRYASCLSGDYDRDGDVDWLDMSFFAEYWLYDDCSLIDGYCDGCDHSRDGSVNFDDFTRLVDGWSSLQ